MAPSKPAMDTVIRFGRAKVNEFNRKEELSQISSLLMQLCREVNQKIHVLGRFFCKTVYIMATQKTFGTVWCLSNDHGYRLVSTSMN